MLKAELRELKEINGRRKEGKVESVRCGIRSDNLISFVRVS